MFLIGLFFYSQNVSEQKIMWTRFLFTEIGSRFYFFITYTIIHIGKKKCIYKNIRENITFLLILI